MIQKRERKDKVKKMKTTGLCENSGVFVAQFSHLLQLVLSSMLSFFKTILCSLFLRLILSSCKRTVSGTIVLVAKVLSRPEK